MSSKPTSLTYAEALEAVGRARVVSIAQTVRLQPSLSIDTATQAKLIAVTTAMMAVGRLPGDLPPAKFDTPITYHKLSEKSLEWLEKCGIPARRAYAPLAANYAWMFGTKDRLPVSEDLAGRFFTRLIHCLLIETQITVAKQYYYGLGLYKQDMSISMLSQVLPPEVLHETMLNRLTQIEFDQLHGRIFLEYCAVMVRAQWDKLTRLSCLAFGLEWNWDSVSDGLKALKRKLAEQKEPHTWCSYHLKVFVDIAEERLAEGGWLKGFRDPLIHDVGQHSAGVVPHKKSLETTSEMWDKVCEEHNWLREGMMAALAAFASRRSSMSDADKEKVA